jgi:thiamine biosynthesis lipoprotein
MRAGGLAPSGAAARGAHVVDPRTGTPVGRDGSATVWGPSLLWADVWATALFVDPQAGEAALRGADPAYRSLVL